jgi:hypothetical protein
LFCQTDLTHIWDWNDRKIAEKLWNSFLKLKALKKSQSCFNSESLCYCFYLCVCDVTKQTKVRSSKSKFISLNQIYSQMCVRLSLLKLILRLE